MAFGGGHRGWPGVFVYSNDVSAQPAVRCDAMGWWQVLRRIVRVADVRLNEPHQSLVVGLHQGRIGERVRIHH